MKLVPMSVVEIFKDNIERLKKGINEIFRDFWNDTTTTASQNLDQKLDCLGELLILREAATARSSAKQV